MPTALAKLPWSFSNLLIDRIDDVNKRIWYAEKCIENSWSYVVLDHQIDVSPKNLRYMEKFYLLYKDKLQILPQVVEELFLIPYLQLKILKIN